MIGGKWCKGRMFYWWWYVVYKLVVIFVDDFWFDWLIGLLVCGL